MWHKVLFFLKRLLIMYMIYLLAGGVLIFLVDRPNAQSYIERIDEGRYYGQTDQLSSDQAVILEDRVFSGISRIHLIEQAQDKLQIAYYTVHDGLSSDIFYASLFEAANRGVDVALLLDGVFHNLRGINKPVYWALVEHPNITVRFFEPFDLLKPWSVNNRLHDKMMIIDQKYAMVGGRNIGDKYFLDNYQGEIVLDRDVLVYNTCAESYEQSVLSDFDAYFNLLWDHPYTVQKHHDIQARRSSKAIQTKNEKLDILNTVRLEYPDRFPEQIDWDELAYPTRKVSLITNPVQRMNKEPWILLEMSALFQLAETSIIAQSPYIIPSRQMSRYFDIEQKSTELVFLTNSKASTPNYFAIAGYLKHRDHLSEQADQIFEYYGEGSIHAKSYIIDERLSLVGSFNLDARSSFLSTESMIVIDSEPFAEALIDKKVILANQSLPYNDNKETDYFTPTTLDGMHNPRTTPWYKHVLIFLARIVLWPFDELL